MNGVSREILLFEYNAPLRTLYVTFSDIGRYTYYAVLPETYEALRTSSAPVQFFEDFIEDFHFHWAAPDAQAS